MVKLANSREAEDHELPVSGGPSGRGQENSWLAPWQPVRGVGPGVGRGGRQMSTASTRVVATRSAYGVRTLWPSLVRNSGCVARAVRAAAMSVPELV